MLNFDIRERVKKVNPLDKYDYAILVVNPKTQEEKSVQKFELNSVAVKELDITAGNYVGLALNDTGSLVIVNLDSTEAPFSAKVNKDFTFNSKKMFNKIVKYFKLDENVRHILQLDCKLDEESSHLYGIISGFMPANYNIEEMFGTELTEEEVVL